MHSIGEGLFARALIRGRGETSSIHGMVTFCRYRNGILVSAEIRGLPKTEPGFFGFHIHQGDSCGGPNFSDTCSHFNPSGVDHPMHAGDLPPLMGCCGRAKMTVFTDRFSPEEIIGRTVVIHSQPDDFRSQPAGNAGEKIACGVIRKV